MKRCVLDIETGGLNPWEDRVICVGVMDTDTGKIVVFHDEDEKRMLKDFLNYFHSKGFKVIIGFNVLFDLRYLFGRVLKYNLKSNGFFKARYEDLMVLVKSVGYRYSYNRPGTLNEWSEFLFGAGKVPLPDSIKNLHSQGKINQIIQYNQQDLKITFKLWERIQRVLEN